MDELTSKDWSTINQHGFLECKLCGIDHKTKESYKNHINGKRHFYRLQFLLNRKNKAQTEPKWKTNSNTPNNIDTQKSDNIGAHQSKPPVDLDDMVDVETLELYDKERSLLKICVLAKWFPLNIDIEYKHPNYSFIGSYEQNSEKKEANKMYLVLKMEGYKNVAVKFDKCRIVMENLYYDWNKEHLELLICFDLQLNG